MEQGRVTSRELVQQYLTRIATYEDLLHAAITVNPDALTIAAERDRERAQGKVRGPLHGIPIALEGQHPHDRHANDRRRARVRRADAAVRGDADEEPEGCRRDHHREDRLTELANWVAGAPTPMPGNYNAVGGQGYNPYDPRKDPREATFDGRAALNTGGSSSGDRHRREFLGRQRRHGNVGVDPEPGQPEHAGRHQADGRPHQPLRRDSDHRRPGHRRADGEDGERRRDHVRRARRGDAGSERSGDAPVHAAARPRLHEVPQPRPASRARASASRARSSTTASRRPPSRRSTVEGREPRTREPVGEHADAAG